jgi:IS30 family transposase
MRKKQAKYSRLGPFDRDEIAAGLASGGTVEEIALAIGRRKSTVSREVAANGGPDGYSASAAQARAAAGASARRAAKTKLKANWGLRVAVTRMLRRRLSPDQVSKKLAMDYPDDMKMRISHEAIYQYVYVLPRGELRDVLTKALRQERKERERKGAKAGDRRGKLADMLSIEERPAEVAERIVPGHWEGDLIVGKGCKSAIATLVERVTRYTLVIKLDGRDADSVRKAMARTLSRVPANLRKTLTYDQGKEMAGHRLFAAATDMKVYFAHPHSPWERGTNENTNGLIRQYFPKGTDFNAVSAREIRKCQDGLNTRPRKVLSYYTPDEVYGELLKQLR